MEKKSTMPYRTISLPNDLYKELEEHMKNQFHFVSIAQFVRIAIIEKMEHEKSKPKPDFSFMKGNPKGYKSPEMKRIEILEEKMDKLLKKKN